MTLKTGKTWRIRPNLRNGSKAKRRHGDRNHVMSESADNMPILVFGRKRPVFRHLSTCPCACFARRPSMNRWEAAWLHSTPVCAGKGGRYEPIGVRHCGHSWQMLRHSSTCFGMLCAPTIMFAYVCKSYVRQRILTRATSQFIVIK